MSEDGILALHKKYSINDESFKSVYIHCQIVADIALDTVRRNNLKLDEDILYVAAMLHDIGTYTLYIAETGGFKKDVYAQHAIIGAALLHEEGVDEKIVDAVKTHVLMGIGKDEIQEGTALPSKDYIPKTLEGEILCFADRFHSKTFTGHSQFNSMKKFKEKIGNKFPKQVVKVDQAIQKYGEPDLKALSIKYGHPIV